MRRFFSYLIGLSLVGSIYGAPLTATEAFDLENFDVNMFRKILSKGSVEGSEPEKNPQNLEIHKEAEELVYDQERNQYYIRRNIDEKKLEKLRNKREKVVTKDWEGYTNIRNISLDKEKGDDNKKRKSESNDENISNSKQSKEFKNQDVKKKSK